MLQEILRSRTLVSWTDGLHEASKVIIAGRLIWTALRVVQAININHTPL
jgi:hypothetical protein